MNTVVIEIMQWEKYNPRKDYKNPWWFALGNKVTTDPMFSEFSDAEFRAWIHILCMASQANSGTFPLFFRHAEKSADIKPKVLASAINKLRILEVIQTPAVICTEPVRDLFATEQNRTEQDKTEQYCPTGVGLPRIAEVWNSLVKSLPKAKSWGKHRDRALVSLKKAAVDLDSEWDHVCKAVEASDFLSGRSGKWTNCNIDWVMKPANFTKVLEGNYDNRGGSSGDDLSDIFKEAK